MKKDTKRRRLFDDKRVVLLVAFLLAVLSWIVVAGFINPGQTVTIPNVSIDFQKRAEDYQNRDLQIVSDLRNMSYADVMVSGDGSLISGFSNTDVTVYPDYSAVTGPGTHVIPLKAEKVTSGNYSIIDWTLKNNEHSFRKSPTTTITLTFEEVENKPFSVNVLAEHVTAASGFFRDEPNLSVENVTLTGPASEVARVAQVAAVITEEEELIDTKTYNVPLVLLDANGEEIVSEQLTLSPVDTVEVTIPILEIMTLDLDVGLAGVPTGFDTEWVHSLLSLSTESIQVVGSSQALASMSNPYLITELDLADLGVGWESDPVVVELPEGVRSRDPLQQVVVRFDSSGLVEKTFEVSNLRTVNVPASVELYPISESMTVTLVGPEDQLEDLLPENIVVEIDAFDLTTSRSGQQTIPARVLVPSKNRVFASGHYSVVCNIEVSQ
ncbi:hypothetical protein LJC49_02065 [Ruminococcaceae bacterium OttesenSCG-928-I18]|nr:hypothetical protein [Ruminococcaceae bacterium OttesenSCG-928-I18]